MLHKCHNFMERRGLKFGGQILQEKQPNTPEKQIKKSNDKTPMNGISAKTSPPYYISNLHTTSPINQPKSPYIDYSNRVRKILETMLNRV